MSDLMMRAVVALLALSLLVGPLGSVAVWRRMAYFGDAASHAALLGVAISLFMQWPIFIGTSLIAILMALYLSAMRRADQSADGLLGIIAHGALALAVLLLPFARQGRVNLEGYLFGNILTVSTQDVIALSLMTGAIIVVLAMRWKSLVYATLNPEMAAAHGLNPHRDVRIFTLLLALGVAMGIQFVGALLMGAFLIIPAMTARNLAKSPESMAIMASVFAFLAGVLGLVLAYVMNLQVAPAMVVCSVLLFFLSQLLKSKKTS